MQPKIFLFDIETAPILAYVWSIWKQNVGMNQIKEDWRVLTWAGKWLGSDEILYDSVHLHGDITDDRPILESLHECLDEADIVIAHNLKKFDRKKVNARFVQTGMKPPSPYRMIDTLEEARKNFAFTSNRLDSLGKALGLGQKVETGGFELWANCLAGDKNAFEKMVEYNIGDITLLEDVYLALRPWMNNHPNLGVYIDGNGPVCPKCGGTHLQYRGYATTQTGKFRRFQCQAKGCGGWGRERYSVLSKEERETLVNNTQ